MLKVAKFGGSSLADAKQFQKVKSIVDADESRRLIVVSASGKRSKDDNKITDLLYLCHAHLQYSVSCESVFSLIESRYLEIKQELGLEINIEEDFAKLRARLDKSLSVDELVSRGEYLTARMMAEYLGFDFVDAAQLVLFDFDGKLNTEKTYAAIREALQEHERLVMPGFYGSLPGGRIKVFSRGGSDISGALLAAAAGADLYENWTDVSGILMADPRIIDNPRRIDTITYPELRELAYMGANVLHEGAIYPVKDAGIPINIRNTNAPDDDGTIICGEDAADLPDSSALITGLTGKKNFTVVTVSKNQHEDNLGIIRRALEVFEKYRVEVEHIPSGIDSFSVVVSSDQVESCLYDIVGEIRAVCRPADIRIVDSIALVAVVGRGMSYRPGVSGRLFAALGDAKINIRMIAQGSDELNIIVGVENKDFETALRTIYSNFVEPADQAPHAAL
ncbi:MAG: aspartate kinase [Clostridia bacterium]|nr:aspartate kinase [Clostridia bacterium]